MIARLRGEPALGPSLFDVTPEDERLTNAPQAEAFIDTMLAGCDDEAFLE
jgi:hypothetical protein